MPTMLYRSTRGSEGTVTFEGAVLQGLAPDGGLYVPSGSSIPKFSLDQDIRAWTGLPYSEIATRIFRPFIPADEISDDVLADIVSRSYSTFAEPSVVAPLRHLRSFNIQVLELFHGPTFAFKDVALQFLGNLFEHFLARRPPHARHNITVVGATSGDTGGAAIYGLRGKKGINVFILHPKNRISRVQEQQMTSVLDANVHNVAVDGFDFDACQEVVKRLFADQEFNRRFHLAAINSINWARILAQTTYYFTSYLSLVATRTKASISRDFKVAFSVPTGNFGDILAGYYALRMGVPVHRLIVATNSNDILHRFLRTGSYSRGGEVDMTLSPAMDILVSSNFERLLWHLAGGETDPVGAGRAVRGWMDDLRGPKGGFTVTPDVLERAREVFCSERVDDGTTKDCISRVYEAEGYVVDPHTAVGVVAAERWLRETQSERAGLNFDVETVVLSTASPGKFPEAVLEAINGASGGVIAYEQFAPRELVEQVGRPKRAVEVSTGGVFETGLRHVRDVITATVGDQFPVA